MRAHLKAARSCLETQMESVCVCVCAHAHSSRKSVKSWDILSRATPPICNQCRHTGALPRAPQGALISCFIDVVIAMIIMHTVICIIIKNFNSNTTTTTTTTTTKNNSDNDIDR